MSRKRTTPDSPSEKKPFVHRYRQNSHWGFIDGRRRALEAYWSYMATLLSGVRTMESKKGLQSDRMSILFWCDEMDHWLEDELNGCPNAFDKQKKLDFINTTYQVTPDLVKILRSMAEPPLPSKPLEPVSQFHTALEEIRNSSPLSLPPLPADPKYASSQFQTNHN